jgi:hypothetical protein
MVEQICPSAILGFALTAFLTPPSLGTDFIEEIPTNLLAHCRSLLGCHGNCSGRHDGWMLLRTHLQQRNESDKPQQELTGMEFVLQDQRSHAYEMFILHSFDHTYWAGL